jgi:hypothetical protein
MIWGLMWNCVCIGPPTMNTIYLHLWIQELNGPCYLGTQRPTTKIYVREGCPILAVVAQMSLGIKWWAPWPYSVRLSMVLKYILGVAILQGLWLETTAGKFQLHIWVVKMVRQRHPHHPPISVPAPTWIIHVQQYKLPGGHKEITNTIVELKKTKIFCPTQPL